MFGAIMAFCLVRETRGLSPQFSERDVEKMVELISMLDALDEGVGRGTIVNLGTDIYGRGPYARRCET
jgi:hypothetical protein